MGRDSYLIVTTMKNEGPFVLEWIAYNRSLGFSDFLVFTNDCEDGTDRIILRLEEMGLATHVENRLKPGESPQRRALRKSRWHPKSKAADWLICADVDEFLNIRAGDGHLDDLMAAVGEVDAISVCWKLFGYGGQVDYAPGFVTEQFFWAAPEATYPNYRASGLKTLYRNNDRFKRIAIHRPRVAEDAGPLRWVDGGGQPMPEEFRTSGWSAHRGFSHDHARLHHYAVRSVDSFLVKRARGRTNHINLDQGLEYWQHMNANHVRDDSILARLPAAREGFAELLADPELARLHAQACVWHKSKIEGLMARSDWQEFRDAIRKQGEAALQQGKAVADA